MTGEFGNMSIVKQTKTKTLIVQCHCDTKFEVLPLMEDGKPHVEADGKILSADLRPVTCNNCGCSWKIAVAKELPPLPTEWKFFAIWVDVRGRDDEVLATLGLDTELSRFSMAALPSIISRPEIEGFTVKEIDRARYDQLKENAEKRLKEAFLGHLFDLLTG